MPNSLERTLVGVAGEYFVAAELSLRGFIASVTLRNTRGVDIIASRSDASSSVSLQIKSNSDGSAAWMLSKKSEGFWSKQHFYVFVLLKMLGLDRIILSFRVRLCLKRSQKVILPG